MTKKDWERKRYLEIYKPAYDEFIKLYPFSLENLPDEVWRPIPDYDKYQVSTFGRIKSFQRKEPKILKPALSGGGYLQVGLFKDGKQKKFLINRLVGILFIPNPQNKPEVNHLHGRFSSKRARCG